jgi:hypothetical protein
MEDQMEILDKYITNCMLKAEVAIHSHSLDDFSPKKATTEKFWRLALHANKNRLTTPTKPMTTIMNKYPMNDYSGMKDKTTIIKNLQESKEQYR